jgi:hypothetical protein
MRGGRSRRDGKEDGDGVVNIIDEIPESQRDENSIMYLRECLSVIASTKIHAGAPDDPFDKIEYRKEMWGRARHHALEYLSNRGIECNRLIITDDIEHSSREIFIGFLSNDGTFEFLVVAKNSVVGCVVVQLDSFLDVMEEVSFFKMGTP